MLPDLDENDMLKNPDAWTESVARELAELIADHWKIVPSLRDHYARFNGVSAMNLV